MAVWVDPATERFRALVLVAGGQSFFVATPRADVLAGVIEHELERAHGDNWEVVGVIDLGRVPNADKREIARLMEQAA